MQRRRRVTVVRAVVRLLVKVARQVREAVRRHLAVKKLRLVRRTRRRNFGNRAATTLARANGRARHGTGHLTSERTRTGGQRIARRLYVGSQLHAVK